MLDRIRKCWAFVAPDMRRRWAGLIPLTLLAALLETLGAVAVFGLITIVDDPSAATKLPVVSELFQRLPEYDDSAIVVAATVLVAVFYALKNALLIASAYIQSTVISGSTAELSGHMLLIYLRAPYSFHLRRNSAELIRNADEAVVNAFRDVLASAVAIVTETLVMAGIIAVLVAMAPLVAVTASVILGTLYALLFTTTRHAFTRWGAREYTLKKTTLQLLQQSLEGIKEIKIMGRERFFYEMFSDAHHALARIYRLYTTLLAVPHVLVETVFICGILLVVALLIAQRGHGGDVLPVLGLYAYAGFRIIPSINRIQRHVNSIRHGGAAIDCLYEDFQAFSPRGSALHTDGSNHGFGFTDRIVVDAVSYAYPGVRSPVLADITLSISRGESIGIVGPTGAGKTTLLDLILGLLQPCGGRITVDGKNIAHHLGAWQQMIGYVPQRVSLIDDSLRRNVAFGLADAEINEETVWAAVRMAQLEPFIEALPHGLDTRVGERGIRLSGGQRQRVAIARALYTEPDVLVFDEATAALDNRTEREVTRAIDALQGKKTLIIIAHRLTTVRHCDRLVLLHAGAIVDVGSYDELSGSSAIFKALAAGSDLDRATADPIDFGQKGNRSGQSAGER